MKKGSNVFLIATYALVCSVVVGLLGAYRVGMDSFPAAVFYLLRTIAMENDYPMDGPFVAQVAAFFCPFCWMAWVATALITFRSGLKHCYLSFLIKIRAKRTAVQGDGQMATAISEVIPSCIHDMDQVNATLKADNQILCFSTSSALLGFLSAHSDVLEDRMVTIMTDSMPPTSMEMKDIDYCYLPELTASEYWLSHPLDVKDNTVAIIGFGRYGQELLETALCANVFSPEETVSYHVFPVEGDDVELFFNLHWNIKEITYDLLCDAPGGRKDGLAVHEADSWSREREILNSCDRIVVIPDDEESAIRISMELKTIVNGPALYTRIPYAESSSIRLYDKSASGSCETWFGNIEALLRMLAGDTTGIKTSAAAVNYVYDAVFGSEASIQSDVDASARAIDKWNALGTKHKRSNYSSMIHSASKKLLCRKLGIDIEGGALSGVVAANYLTIMDEEASEPEFIRGFSSHCFDDVKDDVHAQRAYAVKMMLWAVYGIGTSSFQEAYAALERMLDGASKDSLEQKAIVLLEAEHERWRRDYVLDNWSYAPVYDKQAKRHPDLVLFSELGKETEKDWIGYWALGPLPGIDKAALKKGVVRG